MTKGLDEQLASAVHVALGAPPANGSSHLLSSVVNCELDLRLEFCFLSLLQQLLEQSCERGAFSEILDRRLANI